MRILHVTDEISSEASGISSYLRGLLPLLSSQDVEASLYSPEQTGARFEGALSRWASLSYHRKLAALIREYRPSVLHAHSLSLRVSPLVLHAARKASVPVVHTVHDFNYVCPRKWLQRTNAEACATGFGLACLVRNCPTVKAGWRYLPYQDARWLKIALHRKMVARWVDLFICPTVVLSEYMRAAFTGRKVVHLANFAERFGSLPPAWKVPGRILFVGRLSRDKGVDCLIRAMAMVLRSCPAAELTIVGEGPQRNELEQLASCLGLGERARFCGAVPHADVAEYYARSTICVLPSAWMENGSIAGLEALGAGRPLVGARIGGIPEIVEDGATGFLFKVGDTEELARRIVTLLGNRELVSQFGCRALSVFEEKFAPEVHIRSLVHLYSQVIKPEVRGSGGARGAFGARETGAGQ